LNLDIIREYCLSFPGAKEQVSWEEHLTFKVGGKMYLLYNLGNSSVNRMSLKCDPEKFEEITETEFIIPAPYLARNKWISIQDGCRLKLKDIKELIAESYRLVFEKLPSKVKKEIELKIKNEYVRPKSSGI
jgi:predicted DNA-binding protein (MmcQ/YjbR family)